jgi:SAM-dependent methyltransferase
MDPSIYRRMAAVEDMHWWFASRRAICDQMIDRMGLPRAATILEPGCGTGGNFPMLARRGQLYAMDTDPSTLRFAASRGLAQLEQGSLPADIPFGDTMFDLVVMTDVLEHLDDENGSLRALRARLRSGGRLLLTVPALSWLWSEHDVMHHHRRRYRANQLREVVSGAGFKVEYLSYFNVILFPAIATVRTLQRMRRPVADSTEGRHDLSMPSRSVNTFLRRLFSSERHLLTFARFPVGVSLILLAHA